MPLQLPQQPRRLYETNTLKQVICQLRHPYQHGYDSPAYLGTFQRQLSSMFPRSGKQQQVGLVIGPAGAVQTPSTEFWRFTDLNEDWAVGVAQDFVSLEANRYTRFEDFLERFEPLVDTLLALGVSVRERLGLRFVNEIRHSDARLPVDWRRLINGDLLGMVGGEVLGDDVIHALQDIRLRESDGIIALRHGFIGSPATGNGPVYSLDLDYFDESTQGLDKAQTLDQIKAFHRVLKDVFETSITDELRSHLVVREELPSP
jgi:uncharacterized protein (TIGR04255 family)